MTHDKRLQYALAASLAFNTACVAVVGGAAARRQAAAHSPRASNALHPRPIQMADAESAAANPDPSEREKAGSGASGDGGGDSGPRSGGSSRRENGKGKLDTGKDDGRDGDNSVQADAALQRLQQLAARGKLSAAQRAQLAQAEARLQAQEARAPTRQAPQNATRLAGSAGGENRPHNSAQDRMALSGKTPVRTASARLSESDTAARQPAQTSTEGPSGQKKSGGDPFQSNAASSGKGGANSDKKMSVITQPSSPRKNAHGSAGGNSISPKMIKYGKMKVNLGTIHVTRPKGPVTGGGLSDQRNVEITAHYVVDDLKNQPKTFKPDKFLKMFPPNCKGDPGNTAKCLPTGGNTRLGGGTLHGLHDHITGMKYCVPGSGGFPGAGSPSQRLASSGSRARSAQQGAATSGSGHVSPVEQRYAQTGVSDPREPWAKVINPLHLPSAHGDARHMIPGAEAPREDQKWVYDPKEHTESAPPAERPSPLAQFRVSPRNIGSMSKFGTIEWDPPAKTTRKKQPYGGDGSGLLGLYYHGNTFEKFAFKKPDRNIDFNWSMGPPDPRLPMNYEYSVRWIGKLIPKVTDTYTISTASDDGVRLYIDGRLLISNWTLHSVSEDTTTIHLTAGTEHQIKLEYYEDGSGPAEMHLYWESPRVPKEYIPESCLRYPKARELQ
ncbi:hypothetical protein CCAX7_22950 [Capsulimonas corticalis]|uniref:Uncharacterized protein n=1 Tax=Capsulimonas corticalis TaxID=2219043 RepID=A0A402CV19_9BACT|nr:PA14 domain-containing protein [Capsulimonas corticalis]BDI30244.1 hypothetical protein CCAX7_22950 [Capsulimonas corticalis]